MPLSPYQVARARAREMEGRLRLRVARQVQQDLAKYAEDLRRGVLRLPGGDRAIEEAAQLTRRLGERLSGAIEKAVSQHQLLAFDDVQSIWAEANDAATRALGYARGLVTAPNLKGAAAFEAIGGAQHWKTLVQGYVNNASGAANAIVREGLLRNVSPDRLARGLRDYVAGAEPFHRAFGSIEGMPLRALRAINPNAAGALRYNARRIAVSETHNARWLGESAAFMADPFIRAIQWELSGAHDDPDECDALANNDFYGLGPGVYPLDQTPDPPHPFDQCEQVPLTQDQPHDKPLGIPMVMSPSEAKVGKVSAARANAIREKVAMSLRAQHAEQVVALSPRPDTLKLMKRALELEAQGMSPAEIGKEMGLDAKRVRSYLRKAKKEGIAVGKVVVPTPKPVPTPDLPEGAPSLRRVPGKRHFQADHQFITEMQEYLTKGASTGDKRTVLYNEMKALERKARLTAAEKERLTELWHLEKTGQIASRAEAKISSPVKAFREKLAINKTTKASLAKKGKEVERVELKFSKASIHKAFQNLGATEEYNTRRFMDLVKEGREWFAKLVNDKYSIPRIGVNYDTKGRAFYLGRSIFIDLDSDVGTVIHEMGHHLEEANRSIREAVKDFLEERVGTEKPVSMKRYGWGYRNDEMTRPDKFFHYYVGKDYGQMRDFDTHELLPRASEVISMGLEEMYKDPAMFLQKDPQHFALIWAIVTGAL